MHNCKGAGLSRSESGTFYLYTVIILLSFCFFIPAAVFFTSQPSGVLFLAHIIPLVPSETGFR